MTKEGYNTHMDNNSFSPVKDSKHNTVHHILAQSYFLFFLAVLSGVFLDILFPVEISISKPPTVYGAIAMVFGTILIFWAQSTSRSGAKERRQKETLTHEHFLRGPYKYLRSPTHAGLTMLVFGYGLLSNDFFVVLTTLVFALVSRIVYIKKQENILEEKYGQSYTDYKKKVRM